MSAGKCYGNGGSVMEAFSDYEHFKKLFYGVSSIDLNLYKEKQMKRRITSLIEKRGFVQYCPFLEAMKTDKELYNTFINYLTINVSEFYRNPVQWEMFERRILPEIQKNRKSLDNVKIWSSACSTGDEPYTIVMILARHIPLERIHILATDIDMGAMDKAKQGIYTGRSIKEMPSDFLQKHFTQVGQDAWKINDSVKKCVEFRQMNLLKDPYPKDQDIIVCRNVLIYFTEEAKDQIFADFNRALVQNGVLFIGSTEQIIGYHKFGYKPMETFFYQKTGEAAK